MSMNTFHVVQLSMKNLHASSEPPDVLPPFCFSNKTVEITKKLDSQGKIQRKGKNAPKKKSKQPDWAPPPPPPPPC